MQEQELPKGSRLISAELIQNVSPSTVLFGKVNKMWKLLRLSRSRNTNSYDRWLLSLRLWWRGGRRGRDSFCPSTAPASHLQSGCRRSYSHPPWLTAVNAKRRLLIFAISSLLWFAFCFRAKAKMCRRKGSDGGRLGSPSLTPFRWARPLRKNSRNQHNETTHTRNCKFVGIKTKKQKTKR